MNSLRLFTGIFGDTTRRLPPAPICATGAKSFTGS